MNCLIATYRVDPEVAAALLPANLRPRTVNGYAVGGICLTLSEATADHGIAVARGVYVPRASDHTDFATEAHENRVYLSSKGDEVVDISVRTADALHGSALFDDAPAAARFLEVTDVEPTVVDWVRSSYFDRLPEGSATFDHALLMRTVPVTWQALGHLSAAA